MPENILEEKRRQLRGPFIPPTPQPKPVSGVASTGYKPYTPPEPSPDGIRPPIQLLRQAIASIPGAQPRVYGDYIGFRIEASSVKDLISKLSRLPRELQDLPGKMICDGEPVRIT